MSLSGRSNPFIDYLIQFIAVSVIVSGSVVFLSQFAGDTAAINWSSAVVVPILSVAVTLGIFTFLKLDTIVKNGFIRYFLIGVIWSAIVIGLSVTSVGGCEASDTCGDVIGAVTGADIKTYGIAGVAFLASTIFVTQASRFMNRV